MALRPIAGEGAQDAEGGARREARKIWRSGPAPSLDNSPIYDKIIGIPVREKPKKIYGGA